MDKADTLLSKLRKHLAIRINEVLEREYSLIKEPLIDKEYLRRYHTADYLSQKDYEWLLLKWQQKQRVKTTKKVLLDLSSKSLYRDAIDMLLDYFRGKDKNFITEEEKELYNRLLLLSAEYYRNEEIKDEYPDDYKKHIKAIHSRLNSLLNDLEQNELID